MWPSWCLCMHAVIYSTYTYTHTHVQFWESAYMFAMFVLVGVCLLAQAHSEYLSNDWYRRRLMLYAAFIFAGVVPVMHWVLQTGGFGEPFVQVSDQQVIIAFYTYMYRTFSYSRNYIVYWITVFLPYIYSTSVFLQLFMPKVLVMYVLVLLGGLFYISQFPEKLFPGECRVMVNCTACTVVTIHSHHRPTSIMVSFCILL